MKKSVMKKCPKCKGRGYILGKRKKALDGGKE